MKSRYIVKSLQWLENSVAILVIIIISLLPTMEVIARKIFHTGIRGAIDYTHHLVLFLTFIGAMITSREKKHLSLTLEMKENPAKFPLRVLMALISSMITAALAWSSLSFVLIGFDHQQKIGFLPVWAIAMIMFIGYAVMAIRFISTLEKKGGSRWIASTGLLLGSLLALEPILNVITFFIKSSPGFFASLAVFFKAMNSVIALPVIVVLVLSALLGVPIFVILGGIAYMLFARTGQPLEVVPNEAYAMLISHSIPAIPLFTVAGFILSESKAGERLVKLFKSFFSWIPGGLAIMSILVCSFFTTFTGASGITILALGALLSYVLVKGRYSEKFSTGLLTASGSIGLLFPPSLPIIIYGVAAQTSIKDMFLGGIIPGLVMVISFVIFGIVYAVNKDVAHVHFRLKEAMVSIKESIWEILLPVVVLICYFGGITTLVESSAIAVVYAIMVEVFIHRDIRIRKLPKVILKSVPIIGGVLTILALAKGLSYFIVDAQIPIQLTSWVSASISSKYIFLFLLNIALLITGCFMDIYSAIMVVVPLILPLGSVFGIHPVHLGIIFLANMELGYLTPPVGLNLFLASYRFNKPMAKIYRTVLPFFLIRLGTVLLITYIPFLSTALLNIL